MGNFPQIQVTNNLSGVIELFDVYQTPVTGQPTAKTPVTYTSLGQVAAGATETVNTVHDSNHIVATQTGPLSDAGVLPQVSFPVKVIAVVTYSKVKSFTVEKADKDAMEQTFRFVRYVSANPGSTLATQFLAALDVQQDVDDAVNAFFANSKGFTLCTMSTWSAITSWQCEFMSAWQGSYFLYDASDNVDKIKMVAGVSVTLAAGAIKAQAYMADSTGSWTSASQHTDLAIASGLVTESDPGVDGMSVSLQPVWMNALQTTVSVNQLVPAVNANNVIAPTLAGTINGTKVAGNFNKLTVPSDDSNTPSAVAGWLDKNLNISVLISAGMLFIMFKQWQESKNTNADKAAEEGKAAGKSDDDIAKDVDASNDKVDADMELPMTQLQQQSSKAFSDLSGNEAAANRAEAKVNVQETISRQEARVEQVLEEAPASDKTDAVVEALTNASASADNDDLDDALAKLRDAGDQLDKVVEESESSLSRDAKAANKEVQEDIKEAAEQADAEKQVEADREGQENRGADDEFGDDEFGSPESTDMNFPGGE